MTESLKKSIFADVQTLETTPFDLPENRAARERLRAQMDDAARDRFDDAVAGLRKSLGVMTAEERSAHRGFQCSTDVEPGGGVRFVVTSDGA
jgi:hypothetical protein